MTSALFNVKHLPAPLLLLRTLISVTLWTDRPNTPPKAWLPLPSWMGRSPSGSSWPSTNKALRNSQRAIRRWEALHIFCQLLEIACFSSTCFLSPTLGGLTCYDNSSNNPVREELRHVCISPFFFCIFWSYTKGWPSASVTVMFQTRGCD